VAWSTTKPLLFILFVIVICTAADKLDTLKGNTPILFEPSQIP
jgi:hypothetical protein